MAMSDSFALTFIMKGTLASGRRKKRLPSFINIAIYTDLTDVHIFLETLDFDLLPGLSSSNQVHSGFANEP